ncbi:hypothetical protein NTH44_003193 [Vibrio metoecus]
MATCWICDKSNPGTETLNVCSAHCEQWILKHQDLLDEHRSKMLSAFSPAVKGAFLQKNEIEQQYIVMRSFELKR